MKRPIGVTILAILAALAGLIALFHCLQFIFPGFLFLPEDIFVYKEVQLFTALMWGVMVWLYIWAIDMVWKMEVIAWPSLVALTLFNLGIDFILLLQATEVWITWTFGIFLNVLILLFCVLPRVRKAFGVAR